MSAAKSVILSETTDFANNIEVKKEDAKPEPQGEMHEEEEEAVPEPEPEPTPPPPKPQPRCFTSPACREVSISRFTGQACLVLAFQLQSP